MCVCVCVRERERERERERDWNVLFRHRIEESRTWSERYSISRIDT